MKRALLALGLLGGVAALAARPGSELQLLTQLNGQPVRWALPDGGQAGLYASSGLACISLDGGTDQAGKPMKPNVLMFMPETPTNICIRPQVDVNGVRMAWDGGCNFAAGDINQGIGVQPYVPYYVVPHPNAAFVCGISDAGMVRVPVYQMQ